MGWRLETSRQVTRRITSLSAVRILVTAKRPDRVVVGTDDERTQAVMRDLYRPLSLNETSIGFTGRRTRERIKSAANSVLPMKLTLINEIAGLCEKVRADVRSVAREIGLDKRIGSKFLNAVAGCGGSCFPKQISALVNTAQQCGEPTRLIMARVVVELRHVFKPAEMGAAGFRYAGVGRG